MPRLSQGVGLERHPSQPRANLELQPHHSARDLTGLSLNQHRWRVPALNTLLHTCMLVQREQEATLHHLVYHQKSASMRSLCDYGMLGIYLFAWVLCVRVCVCLQGWNKKHNFSCCNMGEGETKGLNCAEGHRHTNSSHRNPSANLIPPPNTIEKVCPKCLCNLKVKVWWNKLWGPLSNM